MLKQEPNPTKGDASVPTHHPNSPRPYSSFGLWPPFMDEGDTIWPGGVSVPNYTCQSIYCNQREQCHPDLTNVMLSAAKHLAAQRDRPFASLKVTVVGPIIHIHYRMRT